jgi:hypothetical protein
VIDQRGEGRRGSGSCTEYRYNLFAGDIGKAASSAQLFIVGGLMDHKKWGEVILMPLVVALLGSGATGITGPVKDWRATHRRRLDLRQAAGDGLGAHAVRRRLNQGSL